MTTAAKPTTRTQGMNWCRQSTRLAIYLRDGLCCRYCGAGIETGVTLTLDHLKPYSKGGSNAPTNLVTACLSCNSSRGTRSVAAFCRAVVEYTGSDLDPKTLAREVRAQAKKTLPRKEAREMIKRRGSCAQAVNAMR